jgi:spore coat protein U-like protein
MSAGGGNFLTYELYQDAGRTTVWGNGGAGLLSPAAAPSKAARNFTVYGRVTSNQDVVAGSYSDTVVATVNF